MQDAMRLLGFEFAGTGGGCTAYVRRLDTGEEVSITEDNGRAPVSVGDRVWLSILKDGEILYEQRELTVLHAMEQLGRWQARRELQK